MPGIFVPPTLVDQICSHSVECNFGTQKLMEVMPPPDDCADFHSVVVAALHGVQLALTRLKEPNSLARDLVSALDCIERASSDIYAKNQVDDQYSNRRLTAYPAWGLYSAIAKSEGTSPAIHFAAGVAFAVAWHESGRIRTAHASGLRRDLDCEIDIETLLTGHHDRDLRKLHTWIPHFSDLLEKFRSIFDTDPWSPETTKTFKQKVDSQFCAASAHPHPRIRAGVPFKYTLGRQQTEKLISHIRELEINEYFESSAALWFVGLAGIKPTDNQFIPLLSSSLAEWSISVDIDAGILKSSWEVLISDAAGGIGIHGQSAASSFAIPLPSSIAALLKTRLQSCPNAKELGDLLPSLKSIDSREGIFTSLAQMAPSWARWNKTVSVILRGHGFDALITGILSGDPGVFGRAKLYYARVTAAEIWAAATRAYAIFGWSTPVRMPTDIVAFGSLVVPASESILGWDQENLLQLDAKRPGPRSTWNDLRCFHNLYARAFSFRVSLRLSLREFAELPLSANIRLSDRSVDITEKSAHGRKGGLPAAMTEGFREDLRLWFFHLRSLASRVSNMRPNSPAKKWLESVLRGEDVPLVQCITSNADIQPLSTSDLFTESQLKPLANDFGRKFTENALRHTGAETCDIDRSMRHDVQAQENYSSISAHSELEWAHRIVPILDRLHTELFTQPLVGLSRGGLK